MSDVQIYFRQLRLALDEMPVAEIERAIDLLFEAYTRNSQVFTLGNGGSASSASHFACDLAKGARCPGLRPLRVIALTDNIPLITAWANDQDYESVFVEQLEGLVNPRDVVIALSGSGISPNVIRAAKKAREEGAITIGLTGGDGGLLKELVDLYIIVPSRCMAQIEDLHLAVGHALASGLASRIAMAESAAMAPGRNRGDGRVVRAPIY